MKTSARKNPLRPEAFLFGFFLLCSFSTPAQTTQSTSQEDGRGIPSGTTEEKTSPAFGEQSASPSGTINGTVVDSAKIPIAGAHVQLSHDDSTPNQDVDSDADGQFSFANVAPGPFHLTITLDGFAKQTSSGVLHPDEKAIVPPIALTLATVVTEVQVSMSRADLAEAEVKDEEKQRVLGVVPNFYVTYNHNAVPLGPKQKYELAWRSIIDPINIGLNGATAGIEQAANDFSGYGQGAQGYGKRLGASYANFVTGTFIGSAILPSVLKQDPRYFYKGSGNIHSRILYALANAVICKGDNGHWQVDYSGIVGGLASGAISNFYYPAANRDGLTLTFENALIGIGATAVTNLLQEFLIRKLTAHPPTYAPDNQ